MGDIQLTRLGKIVTLDVIRYRQGVVKELHSDQVDLQHGFHLNLYKLHHYTLHIQIDTECVKTTVE